MRTYNSLRQPTTALKYFWLQISVCRDPDQTRPIQSIPDQSRPKPSRSEAASFFVTSRDLLWLMLFCVFGVFRGLPPGPGREPFLHFFCTIFCTFHSWFRCKSTTYNQK